VGEPPLQRAVAIGSIWRRVQLQDLVGHVAQSAAVQGLERNERLPSGLASGVRSILRLSTRQLQYICSHGIRMVPAQYALMGGR
jgi:hypothetical protein